MDKHVHRASSCPRYPDMPCGRMNAPSSLALPASSELWDVTQSKGNTSTRGGLQSAPGDYPKSHHASTHEVSSLSLFVWLLQLKPLCVFGQMRKLPELMISMFLKQYWQIKAIFTDVYSATGLEFNQPISHQKHD